MIDLSKLIRFPIWSDSLMPFAIAYCILALQFAKLVSCANTEQYAVISQNTPVQNGHLPVARSIPDRNELRNCTY